MLSMRKTLFAFIMIFVFFVCFANGVSAEGTPAFGWNTFLGSSNLDYGYSIAVDSSGNAYVVGRSDATWGSPINPLSGQSDAFVAKLDSSGNLTWHTFLGGSGHDRGRAIAVDGDGNVYVTGRTDATWGDDPVRPYTSDYDAFAAKLDSGGAGPPETMTLQLEPGWNMVSVPVQAADMSTSIIFAGTEAVYNWNPVTKSYFTPTTTLPCQGYWVAVMEPTTINVTGTPVISWNCGTSRGWNMIGSTSNTRSVDDLTPDETPDPLQKNAVYWWDPVAKAYTSVSQILSGNGYWLASIDDCTTTLGPPGSG